MEYGNGNYVFYLYTRIVYCLCQTKRYHQIKSLYLILYSMFQKSSLYSSSKLTYTFVLIKMLSKYKVNKGDAGLEFFFYNQIIRLLHTIMKKIYVVCSQPLDYFIRNFEFFYFRF